MSKVFFTADLHFGHANIIKYSNRQFADVAEMNEEIIRRWNEKVSPEDETYILGDISFMPTFETKILIRRLNGKKYLIVGNHDKKLIRDTELRSLFVWIKDYATAVFEKRYFVLFHYPIFSWDQMSHQSIHLYGHVHNGEEHKELLLRSCRSNSLNVGLDVNNYEPIEINEIIKKIFPENT